jgi:RimJ/RimL family protein N-acetyltransferase
MDEPTLTLWTPRLCLRSMRLEDAADVARYRSDPEVARFQTWEPRDVTEVVAFVRSQLVLQPNTPGSWYQLTIVKRLEGTVIGDCGLHFPDHETDQAEVGITLDRTYHRQGYATEALAAVLSYLLDDLGKHRVYARVDPRNQASISLLERLGMRYEGRLRETVRLRGEWADDLMYAILAHEGRPRSAEAPHRAGSSPV